MARKRQPDSDPFLSEQSGVNLTPLIDVVFVVLICFILVTPVLEIDRIHLAPSTASAESTSLQTSPVTIYVYEDNTIALNQVKMSLSDLGKQLLLLKKMHPTSPVHLFHDEKAYFGTFEKVKNAAEEAGFTQLEVVLSPK